MKLHTILFAMCLASFVVTAQSPGPAFQVVPLGVKGGLDESNLSSYALAVKGTTDYVLLDAGTIHAGISRAIQNRVWQGDPSSFQKNNIKGYLISHPHLDHLGGMVINSTDDAAKPVYGTEKTIAALRDRYFSWAAWINFTNEGEKPTLNKYSLVRLMPGVAAPVLNTTMTVTPFLLSHGNPFESTAFLITANENALLYLGDTGSDEIEKSDKMKQLWQAIAPLLKAHRLKAIFIEVSYANDQPLDKLFGHLTPQLFANEMKILAGIAGESNLRDFPVVITHMKPAGDRVQRIQQELASVNSYGLRLIFAEQGKPMDF